MRGSGFTNGKNDSLKQNRAPLDKEKRSFFRKKTLYADAPAIEKKAHELSAEEIRIQQLKLRKSVRRARFNDALVLTGVLSALAVAFIVVLYLTGMI